MRKWLLLFASLSVGCSTAGGAETLTPEQRSVSAVIDQTVTTIEGETKSLADYRGKALLIVNTASECGYTPQYDGLEKLWKEYEGKGLVVLGFPSNDFGGQEPGTEAEIKSFCKLRYGVTFPLFAKVVTKGEGQSPLYKTLTQDTPEGIRGDVKWNFTKFLVDPEGRVAGRFDSKVKPEDPALKAAIEAVLPK